MESLQHIRFDLGTLLMTIMGVFSAFGQYSRLIVPFNCLRRARNKESGNEIRLHFANHILGGGVLFTESRSNYRPRSTMHLCRRARVWDGQSIHLPMN